MEVRNEKFLGLGKKRDYFPELLLERYGRNGWMLEIGF